MHDAVIDPGLAERWGGDELTYPEVTVTAGELPPDYHHLRRSVAVGAGTVAFSACAQALVSWQMHLCAGLTVTASSATASPGAVVLLGLRVGPVTVRAPCRVVYVVDEPGRRGFAYGTLPSHPERGEEAFILTLVPDGTVTFTITAFSAPASPLAKIAGPLGQVIQRRITNRYLRALAR